MYDRMLNKKIMPTIEEMTEYCGENVASHLSRTYTGIPEFSWHAARKGKKGKRSCDSNLKNLNMCEAKNIYDLIVLDWGIFCHSKKLRISGTEDMEKEYKDYMFHVRDACIGIGLGLIVALLSGCIIHFCFAVQSEFEVTIWKS